MLQSSDGWLPVQHQGGGAASGCLAVMSIAFMLSHRDEAVVWRGPKKNAMVKQLLGDVRWGSLDILLIDTPLAHPTSRFPPSSICAALAHILPALCSLPHLRLCLWSTCARKSIFAKSSMCPSSGSWRTCPALCAPAARKSQTSFPRAAARN